MLGRDSCDLIVAGKEDKGVTGLLHNILQCVLRLYSELVTCTVYTLTDIKIIWIIIIIIIIIISTITNRIFNLYFRATNTTITHFSCKKLCRSSNFMTWPRDLSKSGRLRVARSGRKLA